MAQTIAGQIACIGGGYWGKNLIRNLNELHALSWVCEVDPNTRKQLTDIYPAIQFTASANDVLSNPNIAAVVIATPAATHGELVRKALLADKDVFVEKPLCLSVEEGHELNAIALQRGRILMVGHLLWYHSAVLKLKQLLEDGELGRVEYIYSNRLNLGKIRREENILWSFAPHDISVILGLLNEMPEGVLAQGGNFLHEKIADVTMSLLSFPSGVKAHVFVSWLHPYKEQKLIVVGDRQMAVFDDLEPKNKLVLYPHFIKWQNHQPIPNRAEGRPVSIDVVEPLKAECLHFLECIKTRRTPLTDAVEGLRVLTVLQQCQESLSSTPTASNRSTTHRQGSYFVHDSAVIDENVEIGDRTTIWHFSHVLRNSRLGKECRVGQNVVIGPNVQIGKGVKIQNNVSIYEGVTLEDDVFCGPSVVFTNVHNPRSEIRRMGEIRPTLIRRGATLGANCTIVCGATIGEYAFIGAGAVVTKDVPSFALAVGNPARIIGWMCTCGNRIKMTTAGKGTCQACQRHYVQIGTEVRAA